MGHRLLGDNLPDTCMPDWPKVFLHLLLTDKEVLGREVVLNESLGCADGEIVEFSILKRVRAEEESIDPAHPESRFQLIQETGG